MLILARFTNSTLCICQKLESGQFVVSDGHQYSLTKFPYLAENLEMFLHVSLNLYVAKGPIPSN
jgi:hypothetical protein